MSFFAQEYLVQEKPLPVLLLVGNITFCGQFHSNVGGNCRLECESCCTAKRPSHFKHRRCRPGASPGGFVREYVWRTKILPYCDKAFPKGHVIIVPHPPKKNQQTTSHKPQVSFSGFLEPHPSPPSCLSSALFPLNENPCAASLPRSTGGP